MLATDNQNYGSISAESSSYLPIRGHSPLTSFHEDEDVEIVEKDNGDVEFFVQGHQETKGSHLSGVVFNTATALLGASMFSLPWAFQRTGVVGGSVALFLVAAIAMETARMLLMAQRCIFQRSKDILRYPEIASEILGHKNWGIFVRTATIISCLGGCCGYMIFLGQVSEQLLSIPYETALCGLCAPLILISWIRSFRELSFFTTVGVSAIVLSVCAIIYGGFKQDDPYMFDLDDLVIFNVGTAFQFVGVVTFTFTIHYCILSMGEEVLHHTRHIPIKGPLTTMSTGGLSKPLAIAYVLSTLCICLLGVMGYVVYRHSPFIRNSDGSIIPGCDGHVCQNVILNIKSGWIRNFVGIALVVSLGLSYIVILIPAREHIEKMFLSALVFSSGEGVFGKDTKGRYLAENVLRSALVLMTAFVALRTPYFGSVLGIVGGFTDAMQSFVIPPLIFLRLNESNVKLSTARRGFTVLVFLFGLILVLNTSYHILKALL